ncbi:MAG: hypothetical protein JW913_12110 [Chitinispirillaceae bacterium]|nr:hypothetical protein [Chitinispirillaceae bacterium]
METRGGKILEFLKENSQLDLEVPDIAFNVKKSEKTVEAALQKYQQKGLVTARQNEYGRVYWYALPSAPITKSLKIGEDSLPKENPVNQADARDDAVDLNELKSASAPPAKKGKRSVAAPPIQLKEETAPQGAPVQPASSLRPATTIKTVAAVKEEIQAVPQGVQESVQPEAVDFETAEPLRKVAAATPDRSEESAAFPAPRGKSLSPVIIALVIIGFISLIALIRSGGPSKKIKKLETASKEFVTSGDFKVVKEQAITINELETKVTAQAAQIDSLKKVVELLAAPPEKPPVKRIYKKRKGK